MKITADTNVLLRALLGDDPAQQQTALNVLEDAELIAITTASFCEIAWVLDRRYGATRADIAIAVRHFLDRRNVEADRPKIEAGLRMLEAGGDLADGVIAYEGQWLGGETFVSFDKQAVALLSDQGEAALLL